jgi:2-keto-3-deoxy-L-fuconate dehydrogenase
MEANGLACAATGGSSGIGLATSTEMVARGATVILLDLGAPNNDSGTHFVDLDVRDDTSVTLGTNETVSRFGRLSALLNKASVGCIGTIDQVSMEEWSATSNAKVFGTVRVTKASLPHLRQSDSASIVFTGSVSASSGLPRRTACSSSKGAIQAPTPALAANLACARNRVNCVHPGTVDTPFVSKILDRSIDPLAERRAMELRQPHGRFVTREEMALAIAFLASPPAGSVTGTAIIVDGGFSGKGSGHEK